MESNDLSGTMPNQVCSNGLPLGLLEKLEADCDGWIDCPTNCCTCCGAECRFDGHPPTPHPTPITSPLPTPFPVLFPPTDPPTQPVSCLVEAIVWKIGMGLFNYWMVQSGPVPMWRPWGNRASYLPTIVSVLLSFRIGIVVPTLVFLFVSCEVLVFPSAIPMPWLCFLRSSLLRSYVL